MIVFIRGTLAEKEPTRAVVEAAGVGYELLIPVSTYDRLPHLGEEVKLLTSHCVREDDEVLYGFATAAERTMFAKLTGVSGVGPKIAIAILSGSSVSELAMSIASDDAKRLSSIKGVGRKTAEKICVELRDKVTGLMSTVPTGAKVSPTMADALSGLRSLGFNEETSSKMLAGVMAAHPEVDDVKQLIRLALSAK